ncbi:hypothetical protein AB9P05_23380 [Roseivirga sp. BDSF3-8]|uniref:hypothetical protein n=1 Tax=Roseivirga sp. BDSF3-8 TaxID=3241598 RepID=UPI0035323D4E
MKKTLPILALIYFLFTACEEAYYPDPLQPWTPAYTTEGVNTAGAKINGQRWITNSDCNFVNGCNTEMDIRAYSANREANLPDSTVIRFIGADNSIISFNFSDMLVTSPDDLLALEGTEYTLGSSQVIGTYQESPFEELACLPQSQTGKLFIRYVQEKITNNRRTVIFSGTFGFDYLSNECGEVSVHSGRFDFKVYPDNIFLEPR